MQNLYDVDESDQNMQDSSSIKYGVDSVKMDANLNGAIGPSSASDSTERTTSYEGTEDDVSVDGCVDELESEAFICQMVTAKLVSEESTGSTDQIIDTVIISEEQKTCSCTLEADEINEATMNRQGKKLRWGNIEMRLHSVIAGDHPDTREGPPLTMDWEVITEQTLDIDGYERKRPPRLKTLGFDLRMGSMDRLNILRRSGVKEAEIATAMESARRTRKQRLRTSETWRRQFEGIETIQEKILRKLAKAMNPERRTKLITRY